MGHSLRAIIGRPTACAALAAQFGAVQRVALRQGFEMVPLVGSLFDRLAFSTDASNPEAAAGGWSSLGVQAEDRLAELSRIAPIAHVCTEYFGGVGEQAAVGFVDGRVATRSGGVGRVLAWSSSIGPINDALAAIGVARERGKDEFDSLGLGEYRSMDEWEAGE
jgi:hypothetical protein